MKRLITIVCLLLVIVVEAGAVLKERDLEQTLEVLRMELVEYKQNMVLIADRRQKQEKQVFNSLLETMKRSNQNALMLYSQNQSYVFDLTYACHEATNQYQEFLHRQIPFRNFLAKHDAEIAKYDSLIQA